MPRKQVQTHSQRLQAQFPASHQRTVPPDFDRAIIEAAVARVFEVTLVDIKGLSRGPARIALARQVAMYLAHVTLRLSMTDVGRMFERDRTTVKHACIVVEERREDAAFNYAIEQLEDFVAHLALMTKTPAPHWIRPIEIFSARTN